MKLEMALEEAVRLYWDEGKTIREIKDTLFASGLTPHEIGSVTYHLGRAIANFDSDIGSIYINKKITGGM